MEIDIRRAAQEDLDAAEQLYNDVCSALEAGTNWPGWRQGVYPTRTDARRAAYYNYYSSGTWGMAETYDLCIDSSVLGIDGTTGFVLEFVERKLGVKP